MKPRHDLLVHHRFAMSARVYYDAGADFSIVQSKRLAFIGYGNQGSAQSKNLRNSGAREIIVGNRVDAYKEETPILVTLLHP